MTRKAWVISMHPKKDTKDTKIIGVVNARKKIGYVDEYMNSLHMTLFPDVHPGFKPKIAHSSGTETVYTGEFHILIARLDEVDDETYNRFDKSNDENW